MINDMWEHQILTPNTPLTYWREKSSNVFIKNVNIRKGYIQ